MELLGLLPLPTWPYLAALLSPGPRWGFSSDAEVEFTYFQPESGGDPGGGGGGGFFAFLG